MICIALGAYRVFVRLNMMLHCVIFSGCGSVYNDEGVFDGFM